MSFPTLARTIFPARLLLLIFILLLVGCSPSEATPTSTATGTLPPPEVYTTRIPEADQAAEAFLGAWKTEDYEAMYAMLSRESQVNISQEDFIKRYQDVANQAALNGLDVEITSVSGQSDPVEVAYRVTMHSAIVGDIARDTKMTLDIQDGQWRIRWEDGMILPELAGGNYLSMDPSIPARASIFDRNGNALAAQAEAVSIGLYPGYVNLKEDSGLVSLAAQLTNRRYDSVAFMIENAYAGDYIALGEIPANLDPRRVQRLSEWSAAVVSTYSRRLYYDGGIAPHMIGYVSAIQQDELDQYRRQGYRADERVGRKGLELWGESILGGKHGGTLYVFSPDGRPLQELGNSPSEDGTPIYTTIDSEFQKGVQKAMSVYRGAIVVLERDSGRVLAMASSPGFDPNAFEIENVNWDTQLAQITNDPNLPQFNRATQGQYPLGSVFKLITISAGLESGRYTTESTYDCQYTFEELPGMIRYDWTWDHFQKDGETKPSGLLTLQQGLIRSCNPFFWHIGLDLYNVGLTQAVPNMARGFGLGSKTGIEGVEEETGNVPDPASAVDAINLAIGQGDLQVTPLQVARFVAALGNGGTLYRPQIIERMEAANGQPARTFKAEAQGTLPISQANLAIIQEAMKGVVSSEKPPGTALRPMRDLKISVAGKTGTATAAVGDSHAWFAGYTFEGREDKPDIAIAVIAENAGEGSEIAAPIFRRVVELYFFGKALKLYPWEASIDVTRSPTVPVTITPTKMPGFINP
jgi:cell division protein FtsI/penicillin-binding protein 2